MQASLSLASRICFLSSISILVLKPLGSGHRSTAVCSPPPSITTTIMKFFNWMQSKINGGQRCKNTNASSTSHQMNEAPKEEFSDWHHGLLTIGTFGNNDLPVDQNEEILETSSPDLSEFTPEEVGKLQNELTKLLSKKPAETIDLPLDRFLNCPSSLEVDRRVSVTVNGDKEEDIDRTIRVILGRCKDICMDNSKKAIGKKKSISFIFKKMFACSSGFPAIPSLRDPLPESRMEKLLKAMLKNKINPQNSSQSSSRTKFIEGKRPLKKVKVTEEEYENEKDGRSKWVKTDSECECFYV
ncbi:hypothetical protein LXL04_032289 [Taraxacum kok-saghyz]